MCTPVKAVPFSGVSLAGDWSTPPAAVLPPDVVSRPFLALRAGHWPRGTGPDMNGQSLRFYGVHQGQVDQTAPKQPFTCTTVRPRLRGSRGSLPETGHLGRRRHKEMGEFPKRAGLFRGNIPGRGWSLAKQQGTEMERFMRRKFSSAAARKCRGSLEVRLNEDQGWNQIIEGCIAMRRRLFIILDSSLFHKQPF